MKILRSYEWNNHQYVVIERDDGTRITIKGLPGMTDEQAISKCPASEPIKVEPAVKSLADCSDAELAAEIQKRKITVVVEGTAVWPQKS